MRAIFCMMAVALLGGCASVSVYNNETETRRDAGVPPKKIYVVDFAAPKNVFRVDRPVEEMAAFGQALSEDLSKEILLRMNRYVLPTEEVGSLSTLHREAAWAVTGRFEKVEQGSRAMRILLGLGMGRTRMQTHVEVYDLSRSRSHPFLSFYTKGGSNLEGGILLPIATAPFAPPVAAGALVTVLSPLPSVSMAAGAGSAGLGMDVRRTARQITQTVSSALAERGVKTLRHGMRPKQAGKLQVLR